MARRTVIVAELIPASPADPALWGRGDVRASEEWREEWRKVTEILLRAEARLAERQTPPARLSLADATNPDDTTPDPRAS